MDSHSVPHIVSFVIRFTQEPGADVHGVPHYRCSIRHVQSDQESSFTSWADAVDFIRSYIPIEQVITGNDSSGAN